MLPPPPSYTLFPYTTLFRSTRAQVIRPVQRCSRSSSVNRVPARSEEHTSELQSPCKLVCRPLLEKKNVVLNAGCSPSLYRAAAAVLILVLDRSSSIVCRIAP